MESISVFVFDSIESFSYCLTSSVHLYYNQDWKILGIQNFWQMISSSLEKTYRFNNPARISEAIFARWVQTGSLIFMWRIGKLGPSSFDEVNRKENLRHYFVKLREKIRGGYSELGSQWVRAATERWIS